MTRLPLAALTLGLAALASAAEPTAAPTRLAERGQLLFADDFDRPLNKEWRAAKGTSKSRDSRIGLPLSSDSMTASRRECFCRWRAKAYR